MKNKKKMILITVMAAMAVWGFVVGILPFIRPMEVTVAGGEFRCRIYGTHAEVTEYLGKEEQVKVPAYAWFRKVTVLDKGCMEYNQNIREVVLPDSIEVIGADAFSMCKKLDRINFAQNLKRIETGAFIGSTLTEADLPEGLEEIGAAAFAGCEKLEAVSIPEGIKSIQIKTFRNCKSLKAIEIPDSVEEIGQFAFDETPWFENSTEDFLIVGDGVLIKYNGKEKVVEIPDGVKCVVSHVFYKNETVEKIIYPESVIRLMDSQVRYCPNLQYLVYKNPDVDGDFIDGDDIDRTTLITPKGSKAEAYAKKYGYKYAESIPE